MSSPRRSLWVSRGVSIARSHALVFKSQLLLLRVAKHYYRRTRTTVDLKRVEHVRSKLHNTEVALRRTAQDQLSLENWDFWLQTYADLIDCSTASLARMRSAMSSREAADRFETATDVQMLEELIAQWTSRMQLIRQNIAEAGHTGA
jgi:hypothetical protein